MNPVPYMRAVMYLSMRRYTFLVPYTLINEEINIHFTIYEGYKCQSRFNLYRRSCTLPNNNLVNPLY